VRSHSIGSFFSPYSYPFTPNRVTVFIPVLVLTQKRGYYQADNRQHINQNIH